MRALLHDVAVGVGARVAFVGVADEEFDFSGRVFAGLELERRGETRAAAPAQAGGFEFGQERVGRFFQAVFQQ